MQLILIRGLPGSGKSTLAKVLSNLGYHHLEADMYHLNEAGKYCFNPANIKDAHTWCQSATKRLLEVGDKVIVSNTFTQLWEIQPYFDIAQEFEITPFIIEAKGQWNNIHNVPEEVLTKMRERWEEIPNGFYREVC